MGANFTEYTTVSDLRSSYLGISQSTDDALFLDRIRAASAMIDNAAIRSFAPTVETHLYDVPYFSRYGNLGWATEGSYAGRSVNRDDLNLSKDFLEITALVNGDGTTIASPNYTVYPANETPKQFIRLKRTLGITWLTNAGEYDQVISVTGVCGYHKNYSAAWVNTGNTVNGAHSAATTSLVYSGSNALKPGSLYKIGSEFVYHVSGTATPLVMTRGVNGSTAQAFSGGESIYVWNVDTSIKELATIAAWMLYKLRDNPASDSVVIDGVGISTPKDVGKYITSKLAAFGYPRLGIG